MFKNYQKFLGFLQIRAIEIFKKYSLPRWMVFTIDLTLVLITFIFAYFLRFNFSMSDFVLNFSAHQVIFTLIVYAAYEIIFKSYSGILRHATLTDVTLAVVVTTLSSVTLLVITLSGRALRIDSKLFTTPASIILIHYATITVVLFFFRIFIKLIFRFATSSMKSKKKVLIYGAGEMGFVVKRVMLSDPQGGFHVEGFIDDDKHLQGKKINGLPVMSPKILTTGFVNKENISTLILAFKEIKPEKKREIIHKAMDSGVEVLETPSVDKWLNGQFQVRQLQKVRLEDLLGREPIKLNLEKISKGLNNKTILVTGAAGSIGSEIVRQLARFSTRNVILVDQAETPLFNLDNELRKDYNQLQFVKLLGDVTNREKMELIFQRFRPDVVFHAAAYKHVPLMEENPHESFRVNVGGTTVITDLAVKYEVKKFVMISTDKSVNPSSVMGASKKLCEMIVQSKAQPWVKTRFVITRFGNVLGSNGSVIPLFTKQIAEGGPVTVTHPDITRYFMTIPEACQLVLEAGFMGKDNEIYVFDMGNPVKIEDLAIQMIKLSGLVPDKDIKIVYTGLRPGEKLYEELLAEMESTLPTHHAKIKIAQVDKRDHSSTVLKINSVLGNLYSMTEQEMIKLFEELVPEYKYSNGYHRGQPVISPGMKTALH